MKKMNVNIAVPDWARWMAQNDTGEWWFFEERPQPLEKYGNWYVAGMMGLAYRDEPNKRWTKTLYEVS